MTQITPDPKASALKQPAYAAGPDPAAQVRIDKWLWAVRIFKTRSQATDACRAGKVKIDNTAVKPARDIRPGMVITVQTGPVTRTLQVLQTLQKRVGAKLVSQYVLDLTPADAYEQLKLIKESQPFRARGSGRPTKKERREIGQWLEWD